MVKLVHSKVLPVPPRNTFCVSYYNKHMYKYNVKHATPPGSSQGPFIPKV